MAGVRYQVSNTMAMVSLHKHIIGTYNDPTVEKLIILRLLLLLLLFSSFLFTLLRLYLEIRDIWCPGAGLAGTRDSMAQIRDIPGNPGRVATLITTPAFHHSVFYRLDADVLPVAQPTASKQCRKR